MWYPDETCFGSSLSSWVSREPPGSEFRLKVALIFEGCVVWKQVQLLITSWQTVFPPHPVIERKVWFRVQKDFIAR